MSRKTENDPRHRQGTKLSVLSGVQPPARPSSQLPGLETPPAPANPPVDPDRVFTREDIEKARQQEKDKLYAQLDEVKSTLRTFEEERAARLQAEEDARKAAEEAEAARRVAEMSLAERLEEQRREFEARLAEEREARLRQEALWEQERRFQDLEQYRTASIAANADNIAPELLDFVTGNTREEIDASIARLIQKSESIMNNVAAATQTVRQNTATARVTAPPLGPLENESGQQTFTPEQIAQMSVNEYAKYRSQFGVTGGNTHRGLFG